MARSSVNEARNAEIVQLRLDGVPALPAESGDEKTALDSAYSFFPITREVLRRHGRATIEFTKVAIAGRGLRPTTAAKRSLAIGPQIIGEVGRARAMATLYPYPACRPSGIPRTGGTPAHRGALSYVPDAWYVPASVKVGYEISFTRRFCESQPMHPLEETELIY